MNGDLISRSALKAHMDECSQDIRDRAYYGYAVSFIDNAPAVDAVEVVRCKDCKHFDLRSMECQNDSVVTDNEGGASFTLNFYLDDFCSYGERRADE